MKSNLYNAIEYSELQMLNPWLLWPGLALVTGLHIIHNYSKILLLIEGRGFIGSIIFPLLLVLGITIFSLTFRLRTIINVDGIQFSIWIWKKEFIPWERIEGLKQVDVGFLGGYGIRKHDVFGVSYIFKGRVGILIRLKDRTCFVLGTQNIDGVRDYLVSIGRELC